MAMVAIRDTTLFVDVVGDGYPLVLLHGGPGLDHWSLEPFRSDATGYTLVFYDHRCNGRSIGSPIETMTWENLTADLEALRGHLGYERWAVLGHSFGGNVALEYVLRYPNPVTHLILLDTGADGRWAQVNSAKVLKQRGYSIDDAALARRWFTGDFEPDEWLSIFSRIAQAYYEEPLDLDSMAGQINPDGDGPTFRPEPLIHAGRHLLRGWSVADRLDEIAVPTLVMAGREDFVYPPEAQLELTDGIPCAQLRLIARAGHNPHVERPAEVFRALSEFLPMATESEAVLA